MHCVFGGSYAPFSQKLYIIEDLGSMVWYGSNTGYNCTSSKAPFLIYKFNNLLGGKDSIHHPLAH